MDILAFGSYALANIDDEEVIDLREAVAEVCSHRFRRIDRFTQLCLLGAGKCREHWMIRSGTTLSPDTAIVLCSEMASLSNAVGVQQQLFRDGQAPKPAHFINTLSNTAGFYVAKSLQLCSENHFLTRSGAAFESGIEFAHQQGLHTVMLGHVEECPRPIDMHRQRLGLAADASLFELSHWFLLSAEPKNDALASSASPRRTTDPDIARQWLQEEATGQCLTYCSPGANIRNIDHHGATLNEADSSAGALALFLQTFFT